MNYTTLAFLMNDKTRAIRVSYEPDAYNGSKGGNEVYKTLDQDIKKDDLVVVPTNTRHGFTVVKVIETDFTIDLDSKTEIKWIVKKVDIAAYEKLLEDEAASVKTVQAIEFKKKRESLANAFLGEGAQEQLKALPLASAS